MSAAITGEQVAAYAAMKIAMPVEFVAVTQSLSADNHKRIDRAVLVIHSKEMAEKLAGSLKSESERDDRYDAAAKFLVDSLPRFAQSVAVAIHGENRAKRGQGDGKNFVQNFEVPTPDGILRVWLVNDELK
jgi:hypothetical protein